MSCVCRMTTFFGICFILYSGCIKWLFQLRPLRTYAWLGTGFSSWIKIFFLLGFRPVHVHGLSKHISHIFTQCRSQCWHLHGDEHFPARAACEVSSSCSCSSILSTDVAGLILCRSPLNSTLFLSSFAVMRLTENQSMPTESPSRRFSDGGLTFGGGYLNDWVTARLVSQT